jgi:molybdenum cofactor synthesis domain-containing protein
VGNNFAPVSKAHIRQEPFVSPQQSRGHQWGIKSHITGLYLEQNTIKEPKMQNPSAAMLVIGDEILSGRTRDANMYHLAGVLTEHGVDLKEVRVVSDDGPAIVRALQGLAAQYDHVFTSGGIGPTHDDITADCAAEAFGQTIDVRADARKLLADHYEKTGKELNEARLRMARIPQHATLIDNPVSIAPGFTIANCHVMAGVPSVFRAMVESVLPLLSGGAPMLSRSLRVDLGEGEIAGPLGKLAHEFSDLSFGSYPFNDKGVYGANVVVRGQDADLLNTGFVALKNAFPTT